MINSTNTININDTVLNDEMLKKTFSFKSEDRFTRWVVRPLMLLAALGVGTTLLFASAFLMLLSFAMLPLLAIGLWAAQKKIERDLAAADPVVDTQPGTEFSETSAAKISE